MLTLDDIRRSRGITPQIAADAYAQTKMEVAFCHFGNSEVGCVVNAVACALYPDFYPAEARLLLAREIGENYFRGVWQGFDGKDAPGEKNRELRRGIEDGRKIRAYFKAEDIEVKSEEPAVA